MEDIVAQVVTEVKCLFAPIGRQFSTLRNCKNNLDKLKQEVQKLRDERVSVDHKVDAAKRNGEEIEEQVERWLKSVEEIVNEAEKIIGYEDKAKSRCFKGLCPDLKTRYQLSRNAEGKVKTISEIREEGKFEVVSFQIVPGEIWLPAPKGYESFESRMGIVRDIQKALNDPNVNMIGVYGMGGIGKTTLVKEVAMKVEKDELFENVVFADVSQTPDVEKIQKEIADKLGLQFQEQSDSGRARRLSSRLKKEKKILVILDNIWTDLDLGSVGIPHGDDHKGCKLLLTARSLEVLASKMNCKINFQVGVLSEKEAWGLFEKKLGQTIENHTLQSIAIDVAKECGGLPIAIVTIARALQDKSEIEWKSALQELRRPSKSSFTGIQAAAFSTIEMSYNCLEDEEIKSTFFLCSLLGSEYYSFFYLLKYGIGLGLPQGMINTMEDARNRLYTLVRKLKASCLLLDSQYSERFSMHDVVRDVALSIASRDQHAFFVREEIVSIRWPDEDTLNRCTAIDLVDCNISELPDGLVCPKLKYFNLRNKNFFVKVPENFFAAMTELKVLDFTKLQLLRLPSSIQFLKNLRTLCLDQCILEDIAVVGKLQKLEILSLLGSDIEQLPKEIGQLSSLRMLDLSGCHKLKLIPPNVICSLSHLEELYMGNTSIQWHDEGQTSERKNASLNELKNLCHLTSLEIHIKNTKHLPKGLVFEKLKRYQIYIGDGWVWPENYEGTRTLKLKVNTSISMENQIPMQLRGIEVLYLDEVQGTDNVLRKVDMEGFRQLKRLHVQNSPHFLCILDSMEWSPHEVFPQLESLFLSNMMNIEKICYGQLTSKSFCKLTTLKVDKCDKLKNICWLSIVESLLQLKTVQVTECKAMEEIFVVGRMDDVNDNKVIGEIGISQIRFLALKSLPQLNNFCSKMKIPSMSLREAQKDIEVVSEDKHDTSTTLFNETVMLPKLESLELSAINCERIWLNQISSISSCFHNLTSLIVQGCGNLLYIFSSSMVRSFLKLQHLEVCACPVLKEIIVMDFSREEERRNIIFPQLNFLKLENLENLTRFCLEYNVEFTSLKQLKIKQCPKFKAFVLENISTSFTMGADVGKRISQELQPFFNNKVAFPVLEEMVISHLDGLKMIWHDMELAHNSFGKLKSVEVEGCEKLQTLFPSNVLGRISKLKSIAITGCCSLKEIFGLQGSNFEEIHLRQPEFKSVSVIECPSLRNIFPASIAKGLLQLEQLDIRRCALVAEVVAEEQGAETSNVRFVFPKVTELTLVDLPELTSFYPRVHTSKWPALRDLSMSGCGKAKVFASEVLSYQNANDEGQLDISYQQPFFLIEKIIPRLERLQISMKDMMMICHIQFPEHLFSKLERLRIGQNEAVAFPLSLLQRFYNLKRLTLFKSSYKELFLYGEVEKHAANFSRIERLILVHLPDLKHIWQKDSKLNSTVQNLEFLYVDHCDNLMNLVPSSASFKNLTTLEVCHCKGLITLVSYSTARSLDQLKSMSIERCQRLTEIISNEEGVVEDEIVFGKLEELSLLGLESLTSFCSIDHTFNFPSLDVLVVRDCPKMKIFCGGALSTSKLKMVCQNLEDWRHYKGSWKGDLNATIQQLHLKMNV